MLERLKNPILFYEYLHPLSREGEQSFQSSGGDSEITIQKNTQRARNRSPTGNTWSAIPVALLCMVINQNERQGSGPEGNKVL